MVQAVKNLPAMQKTWVKNPWVGEIPWRRKRLPIPVFWPGEFRGLYSPWGCKESNTTEWLSLSDKNKNRSGDIIFRQSWLQSRESNQRKVLHNNKEVSSPKRRQFLNVSDNGTSDYMVQTLLEFPGEIESLFIVGDFNTALSEMNRFSKQKISKT